MKIAWSLIGLVLLACSNEKDHEGFLKVSGPDVSEMDDEEKNIPTPIFFLGMVCEDGEKRKVSSCSGTRR